MTRRYDRGRLFRHFVKVDETTVFLFWRDRQAGGAQTEKNKFPVNPSSSWSRLEMLAIYAPKRRSQRPRCPSRFPLTSVQAAFKHTSKPPFVDWAFSSTEALLDQGTVLV